jgi:hypothetical protein
MTHSMNGVSLFDNFISASCPFNYLPYIVFGAKDSSWTCREAGTGQIDGSYSKYEEPHNEIGEFCVIL